MTTTTYDRLSESEIHEIIDAVRNQQTVLVSTHNGQEYEIRYNPLKERIELIEPGTTTIRHDNETSVRVWLASRHDIHGWLFI